VTERGRTRAELEERVWYRLLKVVFIFGYVLVLVVTESLLYEPPKKSVNNESTVIRCSNGKTYKASAAGIDLTTSTPEDFAISTSTYNDFTIRHLCSIGSLPDKGEGAIGWDDSPSDKHRELAASRGSYTIQFAFNKWNWLTTAGWLLAGFVGVYLTFALTKRTFFYVVIGRFWG
jgi:hypothetical protein